MAHLIHVNMLTNTLHHGRYGGDDNVKAIAESFHW